MSIFIVTHSDSVVQLNDKFRLDFTKSFVPKPGVTATDIVKIEVQPYSDEPFITIHDASAPATKLAVKDWYFDFMYTSVRDVVDGIQTIGIKFTDSDANEVEVARDITLLTEAQDYLFSTDNDLIPHEPDILKWIPDGRSSWNYVHRRAQNRILSYLFEKGYKNTDGTPFTKAQIVERYDVKEWSTFMVLKIIFGSILNSKDDVFVQKAKFYENLEGKANNIDIRIDLNSDGTQAISESISTHGPTLVRR